jgi:integrase
LAGKPFRRKPGGEWYIIIEMGRDADGKRRQRWLHAPTRREVLEIQTKTLRERDTGTAVDPTRMTVGEFVEHYMETVARSRLRPTVFEVQMRTVRNHIVPFLGAIGLQKLAAHHISAWHAHLLTRLAPITVRSHHVILHKALKQAVAWQMVPRNVAALVELPAATERPPAVWTLPQVRAFIAVLTDDPRDVLFATAIETGARDSELVGLRWADTDTGDEAAITITRALVRLRGNTYADNPPKSASSRRRIPLLPETRARLLVHREVQRAERQAAGANWRDDDLVFAWRDGTPIKPSNLRSRWVRLVKLSGLPYIRPHDTRHAHATLLLGLNVHPKIVQERLGHASPAITMRVYSHVLKGMQEEAVRKLGDALKGEDQ